MRFLVAWQPPNRDSHNTSCINIPHPSLCLLRRIYFGIKQLFRAILYFKLQCSIDQVIAHRMFTPCTSSILSLLVSFPSTMASPNTTPRIIESAAQISTSIAQFQERLSAQGVATPSFAEDSPRNLPASVTHLKGTVLNATAELHELLLDPLALFFKFAAVSLPLFVGWWA
jgi:hypothetical protein